jgi:hypothetical protein
MLKTHRTQASDDQPTAPVFSTHACAARGCPLVGSIFAEGGNTGVCAFHYDAAPQDWPRITRVLADWACVTDEITIARRRLTDRKYSLQPTALRAAMMDGWDRLGPQAPAFTDQLAPLADEDYGHWASRLEKFMRGRLAPKKVAASPFRASV